MGAIDDPAQLRPNGAYYAESAGVLTLSNENAADPTARMGYEKGLAEPQHSRRFVGMGRVHGWGPSRLFLFPLLAYSML